MRQLVHTVFVSNNRASFHLWWKENLVKHQEVSKYYENDWGFYIYQGFDMLLVLNLLGLWVYHDSEYVSVTQGSEYTWICLIILGWVYPDMSEYAGIYINMPKSAWMAFFIFSHCNPLSTWTRGYLFQRLHKTRTFSPEENEAVFLETKNLIFSRVAVSILFGFCFRLNIFTSAI